MRVLLAVALAVSTASTASADPRPKLAVLGIIPPAKTDPADREALHLVGGVLTAKLRTNVMDDGTYAYQPIPRTIDQKAAALACLPKAPDCWAKILVDAGADYMIYGVVEKVGDRIHMVVKLQKGGKVLHASFTPIPFTTKPSDIQLVANEIYAKLLGRPVPPAAKTR